MHSVYKLRSVDHPKESDVHGNCSKVASRLHIYEAITSIPYSSVHVKDTDNLRYAPVVYIKLGHWNCAVLLRSVTAISSSILTTRSSFLVKAWTLNAFVKFLSWWFCQDFFHQIAERTCRTNCERRFDWHHSSGTAILCDLCIALYMKSVIRPNSVRNTRTRTHCACGIMRFLNQTPFKTWKRFFDRSYESDVAGTVVHCRFSCRYLPSDNEHPILKCGHVKETIDLRYARVLSSDSVFKIVRCYFIQPQ